jgi:hypothetical protein
MPSIVVDMMLKFGRREHDHAGAEIVYFDGSARKKIEKYTGSLIGKFSEHLDRYIAVADGMIITVGTRYKRIKRH